MNQAFISQDEAVIKIVKNYVTDELSNLEQIISDEIELGGFNKWMLKSP